MNKAVCVLAPVFFWGLPALADESSEDSLQELSVWGTALESSSVFLGQGDIAVKQADHLSDLLRPIPGIDIGGTHSVNTRINIRGLDDRDLSVYIDGALQTNYLYHHMGNLLINPDILKAANIELGANSVVHGGLGGTVRFETKDARDLLKNTSRFGGRINLSAHSNAMQSSSLTTFGLAGEAVDYLIYLSFADRDNFEDGNGQETIGSDGETVNLLLKAGIDLNPQHRFELSSDIYQDRGLYGQRPDMGYRAAEGLAGELDIPLFDTEYDRYTFNLGYEGVFGATELNTNFYVNTLRLYRDERQGLVSPFGTIVPSAEKEVTSDNLGFSLLASTELTNNQINYGLEFLSQSIENDPDINSSTAEVEDQRAVSLAVFVEDRINLGNDFAITPGIRFNQYQIDVDATGIDESWEEPTFALAADYRLSSNLELLASFTQLFKGPELAEPFQGFGGNLLLSPDLEPEMGQNKELGLRYSKSFTEQQFNFGFNVFETEIENYIAISGGSRGEAPMYINTGTAIMDGFEVSWNYMLGRWDFLVTYSRTDLDASKMDVDDTQESLRELGDSITFEINSNISESLSLSYNLLYVEDKKRANGGEDKPGYQVHNISARYQPKSLSKLSLIAGIDNLLDEEYTSHASREGVAPFTTPPTVLNDVEPGRNIKVSVAYEF